MCYLVSPSEARLNYALRRLSGLLQDAQVINLAWSKGEGGTELQAPAGIVSLLPTLTPAQSLEQEETVPALVKEKLA